jgi:hypothetical protein
MTPADEKNPHRHTFYVLERTWEPEERERSGLAPGPTPEGLDLAVILTERTAGS